MSTQRIYRTGLCATGLDELERSLRHWPSLRGAGFGFEFRPHAIDGERKAAAKTLPRRFQSSLRPPEVHILAPSSSRADAAALLLYAAHALIDASIPAGALVGWDPYRAIPTGRQEFLVWERINHYTTRPHSLRLQISGVADIVGLAARLSRRSKWTHAAFFYLASVYLVSVDPIDLHPKERDSNYYRTPFLMHRVWEAQSLFAAFQVRETLDLTVKGASAHRPSVVQNKWDSQLRADLEQRLLDIGVAPDETFSWAVRGPANGLEKKLNERTTASLPASWAAHNIRDQSIPYVDAINRAQWLRSNVSAHRSRGYLPKLNAVDTVNVQHLARSLLMNAVSFPWWHKRSELRGRYSGQI